MSEGGEEAGSGAREQPRRRRVPAREAPVAGYRSQRRVAARAKRRRRIRRFLVVAGSLLIGVVVFFGVRQLVVGDGGDAIESKRGSSGVALLELTEGDQAPVVVLAADGETSLLLGLPSGTILQGSSGFRSLGDLLTGEVKEVDEALQSLLGLSYSARASLAWTRLQQEVKVVGGEPLPERLEGAGEKEAGAAAKAVEALLGSSRAGMSLARLPLTGQVEDVRAILADIGLRPRVVAGLPGKKVEGHGFAYFEPDTTRLRALLGRSSPSGAAIEVQNGSGAVGVAEAVSNLLKPLGYRLLPSKNAEQFPDVALTQILSSPDVLAEADQVRRALGKGRVLRQEGLPRGRIVVIVGKDLPPEKLPVSPEDAVGDG